MSSDVQRTVVLDGYIFVKTMRNRRETWYLAFLLPWNVDNCLYFERRGRVG